MQALNQVEYTRINHREARPRPISRVSRAARRKEISSAEVLAEKMSYPSKEPVKFRIAVRISNEKERRIGAEHAEKGAYERPRVIGKVVA